MYTFDLDYILINIGMFLVFVYAGRNICKSKHPWQYIWLCSIVFTMVLGARYLRGNDYIRYQLSFLYDHDKSEILFTLINRFLRSIGITKYTFLYIYSIPFILCGLYFCKQFLQLSKYLFPAFLLAFVFFDEYCIRQALGFSLVFMYIKNLLTINEPNLSKQKFVQNIAFLALYATIASSIHSVNTLNILFITMVYIGLKKKQIHWGVSVVSFALCAFILSSSINWSFFEKWLAYLGGFSEKFYVYTIRSEKFFSSGAFQNEYTRSFGGKILECFGHCSLFYLGYKTIKETRPSSSIVSLYNIYVIGAIIDRCFWNYELLRRVFDPMLAFWCFTIAFVLKNANKIRFKTQEKFLFLGLLYFPYEMGFKYLVERGKMTLFLWDM